MQRLKTKKMATVINANILFFSSVGMNAFNAGCKYPPLSEHSEYFRTSFNRTRSTECRLFKMLYANGKVAINLVLPNPKLINFIVNTSSLLAFIKKLINTVAEYNVSNVVSIKRAIFHDD